MTIKSNIAWTNTTWSPVTGCTKVSDGCKHCYAEREVETRWSKNPKSVFFGRKFTDVQIHPEQLDKPLHWKKPQRIFVCPRADLFHDSVPDEFILKVFNVMRQCTAAGGCGCGSIIDEHQAGHTFQVLTKRAERMKYFVSRIDFNSKLGYVLTDKPKPHAMGLRNCKGIWIGISVENQTTADQRIPLLLETPAAVRWVSAEPLLGLVDIKQSCWKSWTPNRTTHIDWVVAGGESGPHARPMHPDWARALRDQCQAAGVPFFFKQWGEWAPNCLCNTKHAHKDMPRPEPGKMGCMFRCGTKRSGRLLDGVLHDEYPKDVDHEAL